MWACERRIYNLLLDCNANLKSDLICLKVQCSEALFYFIQIHFSPTIYSYLQWRSQKFLIGEADFEIVLLSDCCIRVTALLEYLDLLDQFSET